MISIKSISTYIPNNYLNLENRFRKINKIFLNKKLGLLKLLEKKRTRP